MAARPSWRGQIRLALVSTPVEIYPATKSGATIAFHQIHEPSGKRIRYEKVVPGIGPVDTDDIIKGFEYEKGEYVVSPKACGRGMVLETLRYADEVNKAASYFRGIGDTEPDQDLLDLAETLIDKKAGKFDASEFHDRYVDALKALIERKKKGKSISIEEVEAPSTRGGNVIDLMAALKRSLDNPAKKPPAKNVPAATKKAPVPRSKAPARKRA